MSDPSTYELPDGIEKQHFNRLRGVRRHASVLSLLVLGGILALALSGVFGGGFNARLTTENEHVVVAYHGPTIIRNGMFFEAHVVVTARQPIEKLVVTAGGSLVHDMTMNTMVPAASEETFEGGAFRFTYGKLDKGNSFDVKIDFQINPSLFAGTEGRIAVYDDKTLLAALPVSITVLP